MATEENEGGCFLGVNAYQGKIQIVYKSFHRGTIGNSFNEDSIHTDLYETSGPFECFLVAKNQTVGSAHDPYINSFMPCIDCGLDASVCLIFRNHCFASHVPTTCEQYSQGSLCTDPWAGRTTYVLARSGLRS